MPVCSSPLGNIHVEGVSLVPLVGTFRGEVVDPLGQAGVLATRDGVGGYAEAHRTEDDVQCQLCVWCQYVGLPLIQTDTEIHTPGDSATW